MQFPAIPGKRRVLTAMAALLVAFGAGYVMQNILVEQTPMATVDRLPDAAPILKSSTGPRPLPTPPAATLVPSLPRPPIMPERVEKPTPIVPDLWEDARISPFGFDCTPELTLKPRPAAMIEASLFAPCDPGEVVTIRQGELELDYRADAFGRVTTLLPALGVTPQIGVETPRGSLTASASVEDAHGFSRVVLAWDGAQVFRMNAYELGARRGQAGHIWAGSPKTANRALRGTGGFLVALGDGSGRSAEVYTFPTGHSPMRGVVELVVEAEVTDRTCGQPEKAVAFQTDPLGGMTRTDVLVTLPSCDSLGGVLELKNLLRDMRLAGR